MINILQWNCNSITKNKANLINFLNDHAVKFDLIMLNETWLSKKKIFHLPTYNILHVDRTDGFGGTAILIKDSLCYHEISIRKNFNSKIEVCAAYIDDLKISLASIYKAPNIKATKTDWNNLFSQLQGDVIICGDFNCHHSLWGSTIDNSQGNRLVEAIEETNLIILNDGRPTKIVRPNERPSAIDLTFVSPSLLSLSEWNPLNDTLGSDHLPIHITISGEYTPTNKTPSRKWIESSADWTLFQNLIETQIYNNNSNNNSFDFFMKVINDAASKSMKSRSGNSKKPPNPIWWDNECTLIVNDRKDAYHEYKMTTNYENYLKFKHIQAKAKLLFKQKATTMLEKFY